MIEGLVVEQLVVEYASGGYVSRPVNGFDLSAPPGSLVLLLGPSGCGKTTILSCLAGVIRPTSGAVRLADTDVTSLRGAALTDYRRHRVGIVFQAFNLVSSLTARENVMVPLRAAGVHGRTARQRADALLADVGLGEQAHQKPGFLSGGQQQRIAIARALALDPKLVVADEPTAHLDHANVEVVLRLLRRLTDEGRIVVVSTHDERLVPLADQIVDLAPRASTVGGVPSGPRELADGEVLFEQGDASDWVYVVTAGSIVIDRALEGGGHETLRVVEPGGWFGEMGPLFRLPRSARAVARGATVVEPCSVDQFRQRVGVESITALLTASSLPTPR